MHLLTKEKPRGKAYQKSQQQDRSYTDALNVISGRHNPSHLDDLNLLCFQHKSQVEWNKKPDRKIEGTAKLTPFHITSDSPWGWARRGLEESPAMVSI